jgi:hypothetical protein
MERRVAAIHCAAGAVLVALGLALPACSRQPARTADVPESERAAGETSPPAPEASAGPLDTGAAGETPADAGREWQVHWEPVHGPRLESVAALDVARVVAVGDGTLYRAADGRWQPVELGGAQALDVATADGMLWVRIADETVDAPQPRTLRSADGRAFEPAEFPGSRPTEEPAASPPGACREPPSWFTPALVGSVPTGRVVALGPGGAGAICPVALRQLVERHLDGGVAGWFEDSKHPGWVAVNGDRLPREPLAVLATEPPLVAGREGQLAAIRCGSFGCGAEALVDEPYPRVAELLALDDGALLLLLGDRLLRLEDGRGEEVAPDADGRQWLAEAAQPGPWGPRPVRGTALGGGRAVWTAIGQKRALWVDGLAGRGVALDAEPLGAARSEEGEAVLLLNGGRVLRGSPDSWRELGELGSIPPEGVSHAFGVFAGGDGIVRLLDPGRPVVCATDTALEPCGDVVDVDERAVFQLADGLVVETQQITTTLASADGIRDRAALSAWSVRDYAGSIGRPWALTETRARGDPRSTPEYDVRRLEGEEWVDVAEVPASCEAQALAVDARTVFVACEGGTVLRRAAGP